MVIPVRPRPTAGTRFLAALGAAAWAATAAPLGTAAGAQAPVLAQAPVRAPADTATAAVAADSTTAPEPAPAVRRPDRLTVHGYLTQGYAGLSGGVQFYGIRGRPSADFRYAALQGRYALTGADRVVVQLNHRRLGPSPITEMEAEVRLNWGYYEHAFGDGTVVKAGRSPIPRGIYNQLRSVGVALPLYRPPVVFYDEGAYYSETIDGVVASRTFLAERPWSLEAHAYGGAWRTLAYDTWSEEYSVSRSRATQAVGGQLWLNTPVDGVRLGAAAQRYHVTGASTETSQIEEFHLSADATRERGFARAEAQLQDFGTDKFIAGYVQLGVRLAGRLHGVVESQRSWDTDQTYAPELPRDYAWHRSDGVGLTYAFSPTLVAKAEHHWDRGIQLEQPGHPLNPPRFRYAILSLSASF
jgi:hypothetical protein